MRGRVKYKVKEWNCRCRGGREVAKGRRGDRRPIGTDRSNESVSRALGGGSGFVVGFS